MTKSELERLPKEFLVDIALAAVRYTNTRGQSGAPAHYRKLREYCRYARDYLAIEEPAVKAIEADLMAVVTRHVKPTLKDAA